MQDLQEPDREPKTNDIMVPLTEFNILAQGNLIAVIAALAIYEGIQSVYIIMFVLVFHLLVSAILTASRRTGIFSYILLILVFQFSSIFRNILVISLRFWPNHSIPLRFILDDLFGTGYDGWTCTTVQRISIKSRNIHGLNRRFVLILRDGIPRK